MGAVDANSLDVDVASDVPVSLVTEALAELHRERETAITLTLEVKGDSGLTPLACVVLHPAADRELDVTVDVMVRNCDPEGAWRTLSS